MRFANSMCCVGLCFLFVNSLHADAPAAREAQIAKWLAEPILEPQKTLTETQAFCAGRVAPLPAPTTLADWEGAAKRIREEALARAVYRGEAAHWRDAPGRVEWLDTIPGGPGYRIRKLRYEAVPGMWVPALLYMPEKISGKAPVFLNVNGHDPVGKGADYKQMRCINQAKRGIINLNPEWFNMGQLRGEGYAHGRMNQLDLCGTSGLAPFYLSMKRGLDLLLELPEADPERVGVAGLSGGGWQTILISALDPRVTLSNPVAGYSSYITRSRNFSDLGDSEQTPVDLATAADYSHLTALRAPRPTLLTYNLNDNCCFKADHALPPLLAAARPVYQLFGKDDNLRYHINAEPGDHNFQKENREALYQMIGRHFFPDDREFDPREIPSADEIKTPDALSVEIPDGNLDFHTLATKLAEILPRNAALPSDSKTAADWQIERRKQLREVVKWKELTVEPEAVSSTDSEGLRRTTWKLKLGGEWTVPAVELSRSEKPKGTTLLIGDAGQAGLAAQAAHWLSEDRRVVIVDPFAFGETQVGQRDYLYALLISAVGERPLGIQAAQVAAVSRWLTTSSPEGPVTLVAVGRRTSLVALVAAGLEEKAIGSLRLSGSMISLKEVLSQNMSIEQAPELFCFGLLEAFDIKQLAALVTPRMIDAPDAANRLPAADHEELRAFQKAIGATRPGAPR
jgi:dienelactone hydrolase